MKTNKLALHFLAPAVLLAIQSGIWAIVWVAFYSQEVPRLIHWKGNLLVAAVYFVLLFAVSNFYGGLRVGYYRAADVALSGVIALFFANLITWAQVCLIGSAIMTPLPIVAMSVAQCVVVCLWALLMAKLYARATAPLRILMLYGGSDQAKRLIYKLITRSEKYRVEESLDINVHGLDAVRSRILEFQAVMFCDIPPGFLHELQDFCFCNSVRTYTVPGIQDILTRGAAEINLFDTPLLLNRNQGLSQEQRAAKRIADILIAGLALAVLSPLMLLTALVVKLYDGGPVLYSQERLTVGGRRFMLYKFRSMKVRAEENGAQLSTRSDDRITPVGRLIRAVRLDEMPQLINILKGDMSIVGPRPERPEIAEEYLKSMPEFSYRLKVKAGLTGYAQVYGNYNTEPWDKLLMDLIYISGYSLTMDFKIMLMTVKALLQTERTAGIPDGAVTAKSRGKEEKPSRR